MGRTSVLVLCLAACGRMGFDDQAGTNAPDGGSGPATTARVTVQHAGTGQGTIVGPGGFTCTNGTCVLEVAPNTAVTLRGLAASNAWFAGMSGPCGGNFECTFQVGAAGTEQMVLAEFTAQPNRVFVTSTTSDGAFGGVAGANGICAARATAGGLTGTFIAYVSDVTTNAAEQFGSARGWIRVDGAPYADQPTAFTDGTILFPPRLDEFGNDLGNVEMYTGTKFGVPTANRCNDWTSNLGTDSGGMSGSQYAYDSLWTNDRACSTEGHFLCVETDRNVPVAIAPNTGKLAFATTTSWTSGGGIADADALCASEAASASLTGTFLAALATTTGSIASRFSPGQVYRRVDGVRLLQAGDLFTANWLDVPPELTQVGARVAADYWTGVTRLDQVPTAAENCNDWSDSTSAQDGYMFYTTRTDLQLPTKKDTCDSAVPLLCLEH